MSVAKEGQIICTAGRGTRCAHKRGALILDGEVHVLICALGADKVLCSKAGKALKTEVI